MQTTPLAKAITTTEGVLAVAFNVALGVAAIPAVAAISPTVAAYCAAATNVALIGQRGLLKVKALQSSPVGETLLNDPQVLDVIWHELEGKQAAAPAPGGPDA